jgi:hypothetical protein
MQNISWNMNWAQCLRKTLPAEAGTCQTIDTGSMLLLVVFKKVKLGIRQIDWWQYRLLA